MTLLEDAVEAKKFDVRVLERNLQRGAVNDAEIDKALSALPDDAENAEYISLEEIQAQEEGPSSGR